MSLQEIQEDYSLSLTQSLIVPDPEFDEVSRQIAGDIEFLNEYVLALENYEARLGTKEDTKTMRIQMKEDIAKGNRTIMRIIDLFQQLDSLNLKKKADLNLRNKLSRRSQLSFDLYRERYTKALREIYKKEKTYNESKEPQIKCDFVDLEKGRISSGENEPEQQVYMHVKNLDFYKPVIQMNRSNMSIRKINYGDSTHLKSEIRSWDEKAKDLENILEDMAQIDAKERGLGHTKELQKDLKKKSKRNYLIGISLLFGLTLIVILLNKGPFEIVSY